MPKKKKQKPTPIYFVCDIRIPVTPFKFEWFCLKARIFVCVCTCLYVYVCMCVSAYVCVYIFVCAYFCMCVYVCVYVRVYVCVHVCLCIYLPSPSSWEDCDTRSIFKRSFTDLNTEFSFSLNGCNAKAKEPSLPNYLPIAGEKIITLTS